MRSAVYVFTAVPLLVFVLNVLTYREPPRRRLRVASSSPPSVHSQPPPSASPPPPSPAAAGPVASSASSSVAADCSGREHLELWGSLVQAGGDNDQPTAADCCRSCREYEPSLDVGGGAQCNAWVWHPISKECWLKHQSLEAEYGLLRSRGRRFAVFSRMLLYSLYPCFLSARCSQHTAQSRTSPRCRCVAARRHQSADDLRHSVARVAQAALPFSVAQRLKPLHSTCCEQAGSAAVLRGLVAPASAQHLFCSEQAGSAPFVAQQHQPVHSSCCEQAGSPAVPWHSGVNLEVKPCADCVPPAVYSGCKIKDVCRKLGRIAAMARIKL